MTEGNGKEFKQGRFQGQVLARLDAIDHSVQGCHKGLKGVEDKMEAHVLTNAEAHNKLGNGLQALRTRQKLITTGISASMTGLILALQAVWNWRSKGGG